YLALTLAEEQEYYQSEEQKQLHKRDMETCPLLARKGIPVLFTDAILQEAEAVSEYTAAQERTDLSGLECWTIDSEKTQDLDDAISLQKKDKSWELGIHISDVSSFIAIGSNLDAEALRRSASVYLPSMDIHMLPPAVSCQKASLVQLQLRPALSVLCTVDNEGQLISSRIILSQIRVSKNLCYEEVETLLSTQATEESKPLQEKLITLQSIVNRHLQARIDKGAVTVENQEMTAARRMVAECMVIYNSILAAFTAQTAIPVFYRHPAVYEDIKAEDNMLFIPAVLGTEPRPHLAMGLDVYAQFSSPLRRYSDLINQRQVIALLTDAEPPYAKARLDEMLEHLVTNQKRIRQITLMAEKESQES
ncbi:MAG: RNB domain-containing ribonuclease, partial [Candidatus Cloacimonetes bacterium]|nr:RNB domain-containing ribonuclease [Candidatus Cloacimonadota bacterium]